MPTINDATVVASAYQTSASARPIKLNDGTLVTGMVNAGTVNIFKSVNNGTTWSQVGSAFSSGASYLSIVPMGNKIGILYNTATAIGFTTYDLNGNFTNVFNPDPNQTAFNGVSLAINEAGTELHAAWASKNSTYPNSFNIRYAKGTINTDGSVTWGAVEQLTGTNTSGINNLNPTVTVRKDGIPVIINEYQSNSNLHEISSYRKNGTSWDYKVVYVGGSYAQSSPSAIFVPQSINGLANGRIWVTWQGMGAQDNGYKHIHVAYSDDGGVTWPSIQKITTGSFEQQLPSITADKTNKIFIVFQGIDSAVSASNWQLRKAVFNGSSWLLSTIPNGTGMVNAPYVSTLYDTNMAFTEPLFIYRNASKVGFYGTWTVTTISVTQGSIGQKSDRNALLTYSITTDGAMSTITEKVNGVTIGTKTATSGQSLIAGLTQEQWDAVRFGKYFFDTTNLMSQVTTDWEQGGIANGGGSVYSPTTSTSTIRFKNSIAVSSNTTYELGIALTHYMNVYEYDALGLLIKSSGLKTGNTSIVISSNTKSVRVAVSNSDFTDLNVNDVPLAQPTLISKRVNDNTLTVEMGSEKWTYTFDKRLATDADILSAVKAVQDSQNTYLPAVKAKLGSAIRSKGGTVTDSADLEAMASAVGAFNIKTNEKRWASGTRSASGGSIYTISGLTFKANYLFVSWSLSTEASMGYSVYANLAKIINGGVTTGNQPYAVNFSSTETSFTFTHNNNGSGTLYWIAFE